MSAYRRGNSRGQALVVMVAALAMLAITVAVTVDGGNAFAQQRAVQNGSDAAALAGAVELGNRGSCILNGCTGPSDAQIRAAVDASAADNSVTVGAAYYTDVCGVPLKPDGSAAKTGNSVNLALAATVGGGTIPPDIGNSANCGTGAVGPTAGVLVFGHRDSPTFVATIIGINSFAIDTQATAVSTYGACGASQGCGLLPIAFPVLQTTCDHNGNASKNQPFAPYQLNVVYKIPLCKNNPGNVGWVDWTPKSGGKQELVAAISQPHNSPISFASWQYVVEPGNPQNNALENALRAREGETVLTVQFDHTCGADPNSSYPIVSDPTRWYGCPSQAEFDAGNGTNMWYHLYRMIGFVLCSPSASDCSGLHDAYMGNSGSDVCETASNGARACIVGKFVDLDQPGAGGGSDHDPVQLIK